MERGLEEVRGRGTGRAEEPGWLGSVLFEGGGGRPILIGFRVAAHIHTRFVKYNGKTQRYTCNR